MHMSSEDFLAAFVAWMRTGRWPQVAAKAEEAREAKYNPWHDPHNGQFTSAGVGVHDSAARPSLGGGGSYGGAGTTGSGWSPPATRPRDTRPSQPARPRSNSTFRGGGGSTGGGGAWSGWTPKDAQPRATGSHRPASVSAKVSSRTTPPRPTQAPLATKPSTVRTVTRNGYEFQIDERQRTMQVTGTITIGALDARSRSAQRQAGDSDRRSTDDGGHYIAARFNGPKDAFNHFAQDSSFNRGGYRVLENIWAKASSSGKRVQVKITPSYQPESQRPVSIRVQYLIGRTYDSITFPNQRREK